LIPPILLEEVDSTNAWVLREAATLPDGQWVLARRQTAGRGRRGRGWAGDPRNLAATCLLRLSPQETRPHLVSFVAALALHQACAAFTPEVRLALKWPNDLMLDGAKLSGILLEREGAILAAGFGVNLAVAPPVEGRATAALADAMEAPPPTPDAFLTRLDAALRHWRARWREEGFGPVRAAWLARAHAIGSWLETSGGAGQARGRFEGLGADGELILRDAAGRVLVLHAGDVTPAAEPA
jgi:BirA family biotin operon repressor/biotin-[acetyl-CoA-carboxylase] ligase